MCAQAAVQDQRGEGDGVIRPAGSGRPEPPDAARAATAPPAASARAGASTARRLVGRLADSIRLRHRLRRLRPSRPLTSTVRSRRRTPPGRTAVCRPPVQQPYGQPAPGYAPPQGPRRTHRRTRPTATASTRRTATRRRSGATAAGVRRPTTPQAQPVGRRHARAGRAARRPDSSSSSSSGAATQQDSSAGTSVNRRDRRRPQPGAGREPRIHPRRLRASRTASSATTRSTPKAASPTATAPPRTSATPAARSRPPSTRR